MSDPDTRPPIDTPHKAEETRSSERAPDTSHVEETRQWIGGVMSPGLIAARTFIEPIVAAAGLDFIGVERAQEGRRTILWVFLDHPEGISLDQCGAVSPEISAALDVADPIDEAYELRVSSPGLDRPLMSDRDFAHHLGREVQIKTTTPIQGRRNYQGCIEAVDEQLQIRCTDGLHMLPFSLILRARLRYGDAELRARIR